MFRDDLSLKLLLKSHQSDTVTDKLTVLSSTVIMSSCCLGTNDLSDCSTLSEVSEPDACSEADEVCVVMAECDDVAPVAIDDDDDASCAGNF